MATQMEVISHLISLCAAIMAIRTAARDIFCVKRDEASCVWALCLAIASASSALLSAVALTFFITSSSCCFMKSRTRSVSELLKSLPFRGRRAS